ncbi:MAG: 2-hydroxyacyl-CoA dehydratase family protein [Dehalococcoidia bacterium]|nr:2-hydroxyacyl-CoA dehydratase family protein [Dehalococcoidia bacterium]
MQEGKTEKVTSQKMLNDLIGRYWGQSHQVRKAGVPVAWSTAVGPIDVLNAMGFFVVFPENYGATAGAKKVATALCEKAESFDYSPDLCSYARINLGAVLSGDKTLCPVGGLPKPDVLVASSYCTAVIKWFEDLSHIFNVPLILIDLPFLHDTMTTDDVERSVGYVKDQIEDEIVLLEGLTKKRMDYDKLTEMVKVTDSISRAWQKIMEIPQNIPAPITVFDLFLAMFPATCMRGNPEALTYYKLLKEELDEKVAKKMGAIPGERHRFYWDNLPIWYEMRSLSMEFAKYGTSLVTGIYPWSFVWHSDEANPNDPVSYMARTAAITKSMVGPRQRAKFISKLVRDYSIDGLIMQATRTCKVMCQCQTDVMQLVEKETGVPGVMLEADMCDSRHYSEAQIKTKIKAFVELLESRGK